MHYTNLLDITCVQIQKGSPTFRLLKIKSNSYSVSSNNHLVSLPFSAAIFPNSTLPKRKCCNLRLSSRWHRVLSASWLPGPHRKKKKERKNFLRSLLGMPNSCQVSWPIASPLCKGPHGPHQMPTNIESITDGNLASGDAANLQRYL